MASQVFGNSCPQPAPCNAELEHNFSVALGLDEWMEETGWTVYSGIDVVGSRNYMKHVSFQPDGSVLETMCLPRDQCYRFVILDSNADGICCGTGNGSVAGFLDEKEVFQSDGDFGGGDTFIFPPGGDLACDQSCESRGEGNFTIEVEGASGTNDAVEVAVSSGSQVLFSEGL